MPAPNSSRSQRATGSRGKSTVEIGAWLDANLIVVIENHMRVPL